ncbi:hypothetical protein GGX14DRAFT_541721 [Mycena pura]|uniref:Uncharacterized protein n=1 Tax=Mycena pura TaxID=153505 RepID=A0AAD6YJV3_9AGAR|nr:hypothetical protein GGX14DRAFT_541721 [Mycena pura]
MGKHLLCQWCFAADRIGLAAPPAPWKFIAFDIGIGQARDLRMPMVTWQYLHLRNQTGHLFQLYTILIIQWSFILQDVALQCLMEVTEVTEATVRRQKWNEMNGNSAAHHKHTGTSDDAWPHLGIGASGIITSVIIASVIGMHSMGLRVLLRLCTVCINVKYAVQWSFILQDVALQCLTEVTKATVRRQKWNEMNGS